MALSLALALLLQASSGTTSAPSPAPVSARAGAWTTPPSRDTTGYWQQRADYTVVATLDEARQVLRARGTLRYVNRSPDTLRELYVHQYLNAFRPGSKWSALDEREGRTRFQRLGDPDFGYERFTAPPTVNGTTVRVEYPGAPDSTVARLVLPRPLRPSDSVDVVLAWEARPSTTLRRQGRRGRSYDFAHWYPKVAVYDRGGWQPNALQPAGEFYGEFGTFDVTLVVPVDQVIAATGVPVSGDPGWRNAAVGDRAPRAAADAYDVPAAGGVEVPSSRMKAVRWLARDVHGFGISLSPDYRYEGGIYVRAPGGRTPGIRSWDTVSVHVLYRPGDEKEWGGGQVVERTRFTLGWLESVYGTYAYPQMTVLHRLESGGTEFPMMQMNGSPSQGLNLHEGGHIYTYGILANNEWRSGWMDEGLTSYQTAWAQGLTIPERVRAGGVTEPPRIPEGYRAIAPTWTRADSLGFEQNRLAITGRSQPVGLRADAFRDFSTYNAMIYSRAEYMYGALRDAIGDTAFRAFLRDYYARWALKHVDEVAMRASAERAAGRRLDWFFDQWVHDVGVVDYALTKMRAERGTAGHLTYVTVSRRGSYRHPMPVGVRTERGWTFARTDPLQDEQTVAIATVGAPLEVRLDPLHLSPDWNRRNDILATPFLGLGGARLDLDWPFLDRADRDRSVVRLTPWGWYSDPGGATLGVRARGSYLNRLDRFDAALVLASRQPVGEDAGRDMPSPSPSVNRFQGWIRLENPYLPWHRAPVMGQKLAADLLDGIGRVRVERTWQGSALELPATLTLLQPRPVTVSYTLGATGILVYDRAYLPVNWHPGDMAEVRGAVALQAPRRTASAPINLRGELALGGVDGMLAQVGGPYARLQGEATQVRRVTGGGDVLSVRGFAAWAPRAPIQRAAYASVADPLATFENDFWRPRGALLNRSPMHVLLAGGAGFRGYDPRVAFDALLSVNTELARPVATLPGELRTARLWASVFSGLGVGHGPRAVSWREFARGAHVLGEAGAGAAVRGRLWDREVTLRLDLPLLVLAPHFAGRVAVGEQATRGAIGFRWSLGVGDVFR